MLIKSIFLNIFFYVFISNSVAQEKYNILWLSCEDINPIISTYGAKGISTPNIDRLAKEGITYTHAYSTSGVCAPSRSGIITGMHPVTIGTHNMRTGPHVNYRSPDQESYKTYKKTYDVTGRNVPEYSVVLPEYVKVFTEYLRKAGYYCTNNVKTDYQFQCPFTAWDESSTEATYKNREKDQPFFAVYNHEITHERFIWQNKDKPLLVHPDSVIVPSYYPDIEVVRKDIARKYSNIVELDKQIGDWYEKLEKDGLLDNTIIFFWSDHGGPLLHQKRGVGNTALHVPLIVRFPDKHKAGAKCDDLISLMDLGTTVLSLADIKPPEYMQGRAFLGKYKGQKREFVFGHADRFDETTDMRRSVLDGRYVYIRNYDTSKPTTFRLLYRENMDMVQALLKANHQDELRGDAAYIWGKTKPSEELYDLINDPYEVNNQAYDTLHARQLKKLRRELCKWQSKYNDKGFIPEWELINMMWPNHVQPITSEVQHYFIGKNKVELICSTDGSSIAYQREADHDTGRWNLYDQPFAIKYDEIIYTKAVRIGYKASSTRSFTKTKE